MSKKNTNKFKPKNLDFSFKRTLAIAFRTMNQFRRDKRTLGLLFICFLLYLL